MSFKENEITEVFEEIGIDRIKAALNDGKEYETNSELLMAVYNKAIATDEHNTDNVLIYVNELKGIVEGFLAILE